MLQQRSPPIRQGNLQDALSTHSQPPVKMKKFYIIFNHPFDEMARRNFITTWNSYYPEDKVYDVTEYVNGNFTLSIQIRGNIEDANVRKNSIRRTIGWTDFERDARVSGKIVWTTNPPEDLASLILVAA